MLATKNFGKKSLGEIRDILRGMGLDFGMEFDEQGNPIPGTGGRDGELSDYEERTKNRSSTDRVVSDELKARI